MSISVVVPAFNVEGYIYDALHSLVSQTVSFKQIIVVNDGSTDNTLRVAEDFEKKYENVEVYTTRNNGLGPARNFGLNKVLSEYVYFFDSDDILSEKFCEKMLLKISSESSPDLIFFSGESFFDDGYEHNFFPQYRRGLNESFSSGVLAYERMTKVGKDFPSACLYVSKTRFLVENSFQFKPIVHEDEEIFLTMMFSARLVLIWDEVFFYRRIRPGSIMTSTKSRKNFEGYLCVVKGLDELKNKKDLNKKSIKLCNERARRFLVTAYGCRDFMSFRVDEHRDLAVWFFKFFNGWLLLKVSFYSLPKSHRTFIKKIFGRA